MSILSIALPRSPVTRSHVCGFAEVRTDEVAECDLVLAECPRCEHRWTRRVPPVAPRLAPVPALRIAVPEDLPRVA